MASYTVDGLTVTPILNETFGAEISGINWDQVPLPNESIKPLITLQNKYTVLISRNTNLTNDRHVASSQQLGSLELNPVWGNTTRVNNQYLFELSPEKGRGRLTEFADTRRAWSDLSEERKEELRDVIVEHELWHSRRLAAPEEYSELTPEERGEKPPAYHRLVQKTPNGEGETFFLAAHAKRLFGKDGEEMSASQKKIWDLIGHCTQDKYTFTAEWKSAGDLMWWDNRQSMHRASAYDEEKMGARNVRRSTVYDDGEAAMGVAAPVGVAPVTKTETVVSVTPVEQVNVL